MSPIELEQLDPEMRAAMTDYAVRAQRTERRRQRTAERKGRR